MEACLESRQVADVAAVWQPVLVPCCVCGSTHYKELFQVHGNRGVPWIPETHTISACTDCGLVCLNPRLPDAALRQFYEQDNRRTATLCGIRELATQWPYFAAYADFLEAACREPIAGKSVLDVGCGFGAFCQVLSKRGARCTAMDTSAQALDIAQQIPNVQVLNGWLSGDSPASHHQWDVVAAVAVIEHVSDPVEFLRSLAAYTKPGGCVYLSTPDAEAPVLTERWDRYFKFVHTFYFTQTTLSNVVARASLDIRAVWRQKPVLSLRNLLHPLNRERGNLHMLLRVPTSADRTADRIVEPEDPYFVYKAGCRSYEADRWYRFWWRFWSTVPARIRIWKDRHFPVNPCRAHITFDPRELQRM